MTDAEKLRELANDLALELGTNNTSLLRRIADLLDAVPPETLAAIAAKRWKAVPVEPTEAQTDAAVRTYVRENYGIEVAPNAVYHAMLAASREKPE